MYSVFDCRDSKCTESPGRIRRLLLTLPPVTYAKPLFTSLLREADTVGARFYGTCPTTWVFIIDGYCMHIVCVWRLPLELGDQLCIYAWYPLIYDWNSTTDRSPTVARLDWPFGVPLRRTSLVECNEELVL